MAFDYKKEYKEFYLPPKTPGTPAPGMMNLMQQIPLCLTAAVPPIWTAPRNWGWILT